MELVENAYPEAAYSFKVELARDSLSREWQLAKRLYVLFVGWKAHAKLVRLCHLWKRQTECGECVSGW